MKVYVIVALILASAIFCQVPTTCYENNYITERRNYPISPLIFYTTPNDLKYHPQFKAKCGGEWGKYGVCCDPWDLEYHLKNNEIELNRNVELLAKVFTGSEPVMDKLYTTLKQMALSTAPTMHPQLAKYAKFAQQFLDNPENLGMLEDYKAFPTAAEKRIFAEESEQCWKDINKFRAASICQTCSGRSRVFFKGKRGLVTNDVCSKSLKYCLNPLKLTARLIKLAKWISDQNSLLHSYDINMNAEAFGVQARINEAHAELYRDGLLSGTLCMSVDQLQTSPLAIAICNKFFSLAKQPYALGVLTGVVWNPIKDFQTYWAVATLIEASRGKIQSEMPAFQAKLAKKLKEWKKSKLPSSRILDSFSNLNLGSQIFGSDVTFLAPTDNMFNSFAGAPGSEQQYQKYSPLNLTLTFP